MRQGDCVELEIPSSPEYVAIARQAVEGVARRMPFDPDQIEDLKLAVGEACSNAVKYGCPKGSQHNVEIRCVIYSDALVIEVRNNIAGCGSPVVPETPDLSKVGGLGLFLIRQLVDEVDLLWEREMAIVKMLKRVPAAQPST